MRQLLKKISHPFLKFGLKWYYSKPRNYCYDAICIKIHPDVFPPQLTFTTKILLDLIREIDLESKTFLELGCGSGIISLLAAKKKALVTASDINKTALAFLATNASKNNFKLKTVFSDLFQNLENQSFDYIIINPPYYPKTPKTTKEQAWFCGENFNYFESLFFQLPHFITETNKVYMILSEDCEIEKIQSIATKNKMHFELIISKKTSLENNYIFKIIAS